MLVRATLFPKDVVLREKDRNMEKDLEDIVIKKVSGEPLSEEERDYFAHWF